MDYDIGASGSQIRVNDRCNCTCTQKGAQVRDLHGGPLRVAPRVGIPPIGELARLSPSAALALSGRPWVKVGPDAFLGHGPSKDGDLGGIKRSVH